MLNFILLAADFQFSARLKVDGEWLYVEPDMDGIVISMVNEVLGYPGMSDGDAFWCHRLFGAVFLLPRSPI